MVLECIRVYESVVEAVICLLVIVCDDDDDEKNGYYSGIKGFIYTSFHLEVSTSS